jgi:hypothetical protein
MQETIKNINRSKKLPLGKLPLGNILYLFLDKIAKSDRDAQGHQRRCAAVVIDRDEEKLCFGKSKHHQQEQEGVKG